MTPQVRLMWLPDADRSLPLPSYQTDGAAGADLVANLPDRGAIKLNPMERALIPTGFAIEIPHGFEMQIRPRSGRALREGLALVNSPGTIDSDYRGAVGIIVVNLGADPVVIAHGERIAQAVVAPVATARFELVEALSETRRGDGGFGSTGSGRT